MLTRLTLVSESLVVALIATVLSAIGCAGSSGRPAELRGAIAFIGPPGDRLFTVDAADSTVIRIGRRDSAGSPAWSPNGATIAYSTPSGEIMLADVSGHSERRLTRPSCYDPLFSPDGAFLVCDYSEPNVLTVVDASDGTFVARTADCCFPGTWSPNGRQIAYASIGTYDRKSGEYVGPSGLFVMNADGTDKRLVTSKWVDTDTSPTWSSRDVIAFLSGEEIWTVDASGNGLRRIGPTDGRDTRGLTWSPDGAKLAFGHGDGDYEVFVVNADGSGLENLTDNQKIQDESPSWSADGQALAFISNRDEGLDQVFAMRVDGSGQTQLTHDERGGACCVTWSPVR